MMNSHQPKNKNPLLSCALTGGFEDLSSGIVLTAAEKPVFTIGNAPVIADSDNFSEVSLDRDGNSSEVGGMSDLQADPANSFYSSPLAELDSYSNLQSLHDLNQQAPPTLDINSNDQQQNFVADGNFNPISAAAALGSAASTVFSTFSNIIKGSSSSSQMKIDDQQQMPPSVSLNEPPPVDATHQDPNIATMNLYGYNLPPDVSAPPPSFFSPNDETLFHKPNVEMPASNTFRLGGNKKKTYAHIPGLSSSSTSAACSSQAVPQNFNLNPSMPPLPPQPITQVDSMANFPPPLSLVQFNSQEQPQQQNFSENIEPKSQQTPNKFSFSSLLDKLPVTKTLFGGASESNPQEYYQQNNNANNNQAFQQPQPIEPVNFFTPQTQLSEQQFGTQAVPPHSSSSAAHGNISGNLFNPQPGLTVNTPPPPPPSVINNDFVSVQNTDVTPLSSENNNINNTSNLPTVNFFNPQQFNTKPFAKVQQPSSGDDITQGIESKNDFLASHTDVAGTTTTTTAINSSNLFMTPPSAALFPPLPSQQNEIQQQSAQFSLQNYSTPPSNNPPSLFNIQSQSTNNSENVPPPVFFNPQETVDLFKPRSSADAKPKNPYSNNRTRGVGLYRARTSSSSESSSANQPNALMPAPMGNPPSLSEPQQQSQFFTPSAPFEDTIDRAQSTSPRPPSIPPIEQSAPLANVFSSASTSAHSSVVETNQDISFAFTQQQQQQQLYQQQQIELLPPPPPAQMQKSDLNVQEYDESEKVAPFEQEQKLRNESGVSNFFGYSNNIVDNNKSSNKVSEQKSALNFFQDQAEALSQPITAGEQRSQTEPFNAINFFNTEQTPKSEEQQQCNDKREEEDEEEEFVANSPITSSLIQGNDTINDITDKMESLSACSRSTLSLFATSELDSTMGQKQNISLNLESLIPKYLEQQPPVGENLKSEMPVSESTATPPKYRPIYCHWFYQNLYWHPFSMSDSLAIDHAIANGDEIVATSGGRYEVNIRDRRRSSIYWTSGSNAVRKCSWFYIERSINGKRNMIPYEENFAEFLEKEYEKALVHNMWNHKIAIPDSSDYITMKSSASVEHHKMGQHLIVKRGIDEFDIDDGEEGTPDHLMLCVSNFGDKIDENADEIRSKCLEMIQQYYSEAFDCGQIRRVEVLPISLNSIDVLKLNEVNNNILSSSTFKTTSREINDHIMRTMLYSNENFYQKIMNHLAFSMNEIVSKFKQRNANFGGEISLMSSSYEALFLFDLLAHEGASEFWKINFEISKFFACGMPTSLLMVRNGDKLKHGFELAGCRRLFNIIHPSDSVGQRIEPLIIPEYATLPPELIDNLSCNERIDFTLPEDSTNEQQFTVAMYFSSEIVIKRILNEIYGANCMDSGSL